MSIGWIKPEPLTQRVHVAVPYSNDRLFQDAVQPSMFLADLRPDVMDWLDVQDSGWGIILRYRYSGLVIDVSSMDIALLFKLAWGGV